MGQTMSSINLYSAEKKDVEIICDLLNNFKDEDLKDLDYPEVDDKKLINFVNLIMQKGTIILLKDLDLNEVIGCAIFNKTEYWFSKSECIHIHTIYVKKSFRNFKLVTALVDSIKKVGKNLPMYLSVTSGLNIDPVFKKLGFKNLGSNWRLN
jgi:N-acetylglutamate synthase-like GNAT family acetyltransferase|tara:strand:- start:217 stop:672 length:456 start_codon:yes stop_codon:yes gene_type:complete